MGMGRVGGVTCYTKPQVISDHQKTLPITERVLSGPGEAIKVYRTWYQAPITSTVFPQGFKNFFLPSSTSLKCF